MFSMILNCIAAQIKKNRKRKKKWQKKVRTSIPTGRQQRQARREKTAHINIYMTLARLNFSCRCFFSSCKF